MKLTSKNKWIIVAVIVIIIAIIVYFYFFRNRQKGLLNKDGDVLNQTDNQPKLFAINSVDDFINATKYLANTKPFGYRLTSLEAKKDYLTSIGINKLKEIYPLLQDISKNSEADNTTLINFLQKLFS